jgi:hypothetical protein
MTLVRANFVTPVALSWLQNKRKPSGQFNLRKGRSRMQVWDRLSKSKGDFIVGLRYGYPLCCVLNFTIDSLLGIPSGLSRGESHHAEIGPYVPCHFHKRVRHTLTRRESMLLLKSGYSVEHLAPTDLIETKVNGRLVSRMRIPVGLDAIYVSQIKLRN